MPKFLSEETRKARKSAKNTIWYEQNRQRRIEYNKKYRESNEEDILNYYEFNKERILGVNKKYRKENKDKIVIINREYSKNNRDKRNSIEHRRRARKAGNGGSYTLEQLKERFDQLGNVCYYCNIPGKMTVDHMTPISRGGTNNIDNIVPACLSCNTKKNSKTASEYLNSLTDKDIARNLLAVAEYKATH